jgi:hypothetical protein
MGFAGGERTTRRAVAQVEEAFRAGRRRVFRPWIPEPGLWIGSRAGFKCTAPPMARSLVPAHHRDGTGRRCRHGVRVRLRAAGSLGPWVSGRCRRRSGR